MHSTTVKKVLAATFACVVAVCAVLPSFAADEFALQRAEFAKYYRQITGKSPAMMPLMES